MATLTAAGLNASDGTLNGQYTGTAYNYTAYPVGSIVEARYSGGNINMNGNSPTIYASSGVPQQLFMGSNDGGGASYALAGTWRSRGRGAAVSCVWFFLLQRVA